MLFISTGFPYDAVIIKFYMPLCVSLFDMSKMDFQIKKAETQDIPALAEINRLTYMPETATMIAFPNWPDEKNMFNFFQERIKERFRSPHTTVYKAVSSTTNEILGFVCWTLEGSEEEYSGEQGPVLTPVEAATQKFPDGLNIGFVKSNGGDVERLHKALATSKQFFVSTLAVPPRYQRQGIGSKLLRHCLDIADQMSLSTCLVCFPGSHNLYLRHGFEDVEHVDTDLNYWDRSRYRGFGIWRNYAMRRLPK